MSVMKGFEFLKNSVMSEFKNSPFLLLSIHDNPKSKSKVLRQVLKISSFIQLIKSLSCRAIHYRITLHFTFININKKTLEFLVCNKKADEAMYKSKYNGKSTYSIVKL